jgi:hypothetical protein
VAISCLVSSVAGLGGALWCAYRIDQSLHCTCVTACEAACARHYNNLYMCDPARPQPCDDAVNLDRANEAACLKVCPPAKT